MLTGRVFVSGNQRNKLSKCESFHKCPFESLLELAIVSDVFSFAAQLHSDADRGDGSVRYVLNGEGAGSLFKIDEKSGDIHATKRLDREEKAYYVLHAKAVNRFTNEALEGQSEFIIKIHDINDNEPRFTKELYVARVPEMSDIGELRAPVRSSPNQSR